MRKSELTREKQRLLWEVYIVEKEQWWIGVVLSQGKEVEIIEPEHIKERIINSAKDILFLYDKL